MFLIVAHHFAVNSDVLDIMYDSKPTANSFFLVLSGAWGKAGINSIIRITEYLMCKSNTAIKCM